MANWPCVKTELENLDNKIISRAIFNIQSINPEWKSFLRKQIKEQYFIDAFKLLKKNIIKCHFTGHYIYPNPEDVLKVFKMKELAPSNIKVVILGQDAYIGSKLVGKNGEIIRVPQAHGLSFSVPDKFDIPPSLKIIFEEIKKEYDEFKNDQTKSDEFKSDEFKNDNQIPEFYNGNLTEWAKQGVFLLNSSLTVIAGESNSHYPYWCEFTDTIIKYINDNTNGVVFMLWGQFANKKKYLIDDKKHLILSAGHPSPLNKTNPFIGCGCFKKCNEYLAKQKKDIINWSTHVNINNKKI